MGLLPSSSSPSPVVLDVCHHVSELGEGNGNPLQCSCLENLRTGEPGGLPSVGLHRVGHNWSDLAELLQFYLSEALRLDVFWLILLFWGVKLGFY